jgi:hypothetical protein
MDKKFCNDTEEFEIGGTKPYQNIQRYVNVENNRNLDDIHGFYAAFTRPI